MSEFEIFTLIFYQSKMAGRFVCFISFQYLVSSLSQMVNKNVLHE